MKKRVLSVLLAIVMVVGLFPVTAGALPSHNHSICGATCSHDTDAAQEGTQPHSTVTYTAWDGAGDFPGGNVYLTGDGDVNYNRDITIPSGTTVNLCLHGNTLNMGSYTITVKGTLNICDCGGGGEITNESNSYFLVCVSGGEINIFGGTVTSSYGISNTGTINVYSGGTVKSIANDFYGITNSGAVSINGGTVTATGLRSHGIYNTDSGTVTVNSGAVSGKTHGIYNNSNSTVTVSGGSITGTTYGVRNEGGTVTVSGGTVTATENSGAYGLYNTGSVTVNGDTAEVSGSTGIYNTNSGTVTVSSGTINGTIYQGIVNGGSNSTVTVSGGTVTGAKYGIHNTSATGSNATVTVNSGSITGAMYGIYSENSNATVTVSGGSITGTTYGIYNKNDTGTVKVAVSDGGSVTGTNSYGIYNYGGKVTVSDGGSVTGSTGIYNSGTAIVEGGTITGTGDTAYGIYNNTTLELSGSPTISGTAAGIYLLSGKVITISGELSNSSQYTVKTAGDPAEEAPIQIAAASGTDYSTHFDPVDPEQHTILYNREDNCLYLAVTPPHSHDMSAACGGSGVTYTAWDGTTAFPGGDVYLTADVNKAITISSGTVNLCLKGHSITSNGNSTITVGGDATLNICDCSTGETGGKIANTYSVSQGRGINNSGTVNVYGGTIEATGLMGRGIYNDGSGTVNISGGIVSGKSYGIYNNGTGAVNIIGGNVNEGIYNSSTGAVTVSGGTVESTSYGIQNNGASTIAVSGGSVSGNAVGISNNNGGTVTVSGGNVSSERGHGIFSGSSQNTVTVTGGSITASSSECYGIYNSYGKVTVDGGSVTATGSDGRGIYNDSGTLTVSGGSITATGSESYGIENRFSKSFALRGVPAISGTAADVYLFSEVVITIADALSTYAPENAISVKWEKWDDDYNKVSVSGTFTSGWTAKMGENAANYGSYFTSAMDGYTVQPDGSGELKLAEPPAAETHSHDNCGVANCTNTTHNHSEVSKWIKLTKENIKTYVTKSGSSYILTPGSYYLGEDITLSDVANDCTFIYMIASGTYNVCLNGNTITGSGSAPVFRANDTNAVLSICDCSEPSTGKITGGKNGGVYIDDGTVNLYGGSITGNTVYQQGAGVYVSSGTFNMYGGSISNNTFTSSSDRKGGGVYVSSGTFNMYGGTISDHVSSDGGGVYVSSGTFNMSGTAAISGNSASSQGGGVYVYSGTFTMTGGKITDNNANNNSGGVHNWGGTFNVSGSPVVTDNTVGTAENNIYCANDITITGALTADAQIGVNYPSETKFTSGWTDAMGKSETDYEKYFTSDNSGFEIVKNDSGELELKKPTIPVTDVVLDKSSITLDVNGTAELAATVLPDDATDKTVSWTSSDPTVAKVEDGLVTAQKPGTATITATTTDGGITATCEVTVNKIAITGTIVVTTVTEPKVGETYTPNVNVSTDLTTGYYSMSGDSFSPSASSTPIKAGTDYTLSVTFQPYSGYFFGENIQATFNGKAVEITRLNVGGTIYLQIKHTYSFPAAVPNSVDILRNGAPADTASILLPGINETDATVDFTAKVLDQYGQEMTGQTVEWSITGTDTTGISVTGGVLTVTKDAAEGDYTLTATCGEKSDSITIKVEKAESVLTTVKIFDGGGAGNEITTVDRTIPDVGYTLYINSAAKGYDQYGEVMTGLTFTWSNTNTDAEISLVNGYVTIKSGAQEGSFSYTATCGGKSATVTVNLTKKIYTVTYTDNVADETIFADAPVTVQSGGTAPAYPYATPTRSGYVFAGWYTSTDGGTTLSAAAYDFDTPVTGNLTLYAKWTEKAAVSITETAQTYTWDGNPKSFAISGTPNTGFTVQYKVNGNWTTTAPSAVGTYDVIITRAEDDTYKAYEKTIYGGLVINAAMAVDEPTVVGTYTYTGREQTVALDGVESYMTITDGNKGTNAGGYEVVITLDSNHIWKDGFDGRVQWSIGKAEPTVTWPTGTAYVKDASVTLTGGSAAGVGTETSVEGGFTLGTVDLTSAGTTTATITFAPNDTNYKNVEKTDYTVTVSKRTVESVAAQASITNAVYGTEQNALGLPASVEITVSGNKKFTVPVEWSGYDATNLNAQTLTGTLDLTDIAAEVQQADPAITASIVVDLQEKNAAAFTYENKTETYNGSPISHEISGTPEGVASISYSYVGTDGTEYAASATAPTNVGTYEVTATFTMEDGYASIDSKTATLTIAPKEIGLDWSELTAAELIYSGTAMTLTATATGLADGDSCTVTVELVGDNINVGTFSYKATALSNANYKLPADVNSPEYTITPKTLTITAEDKEAYVGNNQPELTYTVDGLVEDDALTTVPTLTTDVNMYKAGTYTITASGADAGDNYSITYVNGTLTVKKYPYIPIIPSKPTYPADPPAVDDDDDDVIVEPEEDNTTCLGDWTCPMYPFLDLELSAWYHDGIHYCIEHGLMVGTGTNIFEPNIATSRAMIVTILWRLEGSPVVNYAMDFEDVAADQWYTEAIRWAASEKIVEGYGNGQFGTNDAITREQMVTIMFRYAKYKGYDVSVGENTNILSYDDAFDVAEWAIPAMQWACGSGLIQGIADGNQMNLAPQGNATRAQAAAILQRFCENVANKK